MTEEMVFDDFISTREELEHKVNTLTPFRTTSSFISRGNLIVAGFSSYEEVQKELVKVTGKYDLRVFFPSDKTPHPLRGTLVSLVIAESGEILETRKMTKRGSLVFRRVPDKMVRIKVS